MVNKITQNTQEKIQEGIDIFDKLAETKYVNPKEKKFSLTDRTWPDKEINKAPIFASVGLRDGNQSLETPMTVEKKLEYFDILINMGFKEIEIGFPSASQEDFDFTRRLIEENRIPKGVKIGVLTQAKGNLIKKTRESLEGAENVIVHLYNSTSEVQRKIVFNKNEDEIIELAEYGVEEIKKNFKDFSGNIQLEYSPESFTGTDIDFAKDICNRVIDKWGDFGKSDVIINLPATIENSTPDVYADEIEYMVRNVKTVNEKVNVIISVHTHNDRGTGIAATELAIKAGADRVEGVLLGNGERTGNAPIDVLALNLVTQGVSPNLNLSEWGEYSKRISELISMEIPDRYPYIGKFVNLAFSGSHQDAIKKCFDYFKNKTSEWINAYLPFDPKDIGLKYEPIKINSQSGKGGASYILEKNGYYIPKKVQKFIGIKIQENADKKKGMLEEKEIVEIFEETFINNIGYVDYSDFNEVLFKGKGIIENFSEYISKKLNIEFNIKFYEKKSLSEGRDSYAISYFILEIDGNDILGIGKDKDILEANKKGIVGALNNYFNNN